MFNSMVQNMVAHQRSYENHIINNGGMGYNKNTPSRLISAIAHGAHDSHIQKVQNLTLMNHYQ